MIDNDVSRSFTFETLPNEILFEIFEYLAIQDIYRIFLDLNHRFKSILENDSFPQNLLYLNWNTNNEYDRDQTFVRFFAHRIIKLVIVHHCRKNDNRLRLLDLADFRNIRSLTIENPTVAQCQKIHRRFLPYLEHLTISNTRWLFDYDDQSIDFYPSSFPHLCTLHIDHTIWSIKFSSNDLPAEFLRSVSIHTNQPRLDYPKILSICPNLVRLKLILGGGGRTHSGEHPAQITPSCRHLNVRRLVLDAHNCLSSVLVDFILGFVPNLTNLTMIDGPFVDRIDTLATILHRHTVHLEFLCIIKMILSRDRAHPLTDLQNLHPLFLWIDLHLPKSIRDNTRLTIGSHKTLIDANK